MIPRSSLTRIGSFVKVHGIHGEISADIDLDPDDLRHLKCIFVYIDGLAVPMFISALRPRGHGALLVTVDGIDDERKAKSLAGKDIYALTDELPDDNGDDGNFYLDDLMGYTVVDRIDGRDVPVGTVTDYDDSTANILLIVETPAGKTVSVPVADELVVDIDNSRKTITMNLPVGLIDL